MNTFGVGLALSSTISVLLGHLCAELHAGNAERFGLATFAAGLPSLVIGAWWATTLRSTTARLAPQFRSRLGFSVGAAMLCAGASASLWALCQGHGLALAVGSAIMASSVGVMVWGPALIVALIVFEIPIHWARAQTGRNLSDEDRAEVGLGVIVATLCALAALGTRGHLVPPPAVERLSAWQQDLDHLGRVLLVTVEGLGVGTGLTAVLAVLARGVARKRFVARAEAGELRHFRVDDRAEGRVIVRLAREGSDYRAEHVDEHDLFELADDGSAKRAVIRREGSD